MSKIQVYQGHSRGGGFSWTPFQINDIHDYCYALEKLRAEMYLLQYIPTFSVVYETRNYWGGGLIGLVYMVAIIYDKNYVAIYTRECALPDNTLYANY